MTPDCMVYNVAQPGGTQKVSVPVDPEITQKMFNLSVNQGPKVTTLESNVSSNIRNPEFGKTVYAEESSIAPSQKKGKFQRSDDTNWYVTVEVRNLPKMDVIGSCDPYFKFYLDDDFSHGERSHTIKNKRDGSWTFSLPRSRIEAARNIKIRWYDYDGIGKDDHIGDSNFAMQGAIAEILAGRSN